MGTGVSTAPGDDNGSNGSRSISHSYPTVQDTNPNSNKQTSSSSKFQAVLKSIRRTGGKFKRQASERCHQFEKSYYKRRDPGYIDYSVYGEDEDANDPNDPYVYQLKRTRAWHQKRWFNMAAFNERLGKEFNATKRNFRVYYNKLMMRGDKSAEARKEKARQKKLEDEKWKEFFVKTQAKYNDEVKARDEARRLLEEEKRRQEEEEARRAPPDLHPCTNMTMEERVEYYENIFHYTLTRAQWVDSPNWRSLEVPKNHRKQLAEPSSSSTSSSCCTSLEGSGSGEEEDECSSSGEADSPSRSHSSSD